MGERSPPPEIPLIVGLAEERLDGGLGLEIEADEEEMGGEAGINVGIRQ